MTTHPDALAEELRESIGRIVRATRALTDGLPQTQSASLGLLDRQGPMTIAELARARGVKHQGQSRTVAELEERGFVVRGVADGDRRVSVIRLTDAGRDVMLRERRARAGTFASVIDSDLSDAERAVLAQVPELLHRIAGRLER
ncbi:MarR family winged helix-turn-helix transcriptional regulator [Curtobacterium pusillum]|uniref:MarR family transcriptional regulator n=1 Tax=Curtobacterium pusillum TaxID=69373 RepID=A0AAW3T4N3_9MICO|nr:MarR family transcriptional regulator [Curtobacterium pusillum]MBA8989582.1 DNA-binding MarR family transcriptional regulator [Curtobacterium pusillum]NUU14926.1 MarR family transcriptional regulator [Curtobacterium pusillum]